MTEFFPIIFFFIFMAIVSAITGVLLRMLVPGWWEYRWVRMGAYLVPFFGGICIFIWAAGTLLNIQVFNGIGASGAALTIVIQIAMLLSLPLSGAWQWILKLVRKNFVRKTEPEQGRRQVLKAVAAFFPVAAITNGAFGVANSFGAVKVPYIKMKFPNLPADLEGLKILQISDIHLGYYVILDDLDDALIELKEHEPDIILITGDIADDLTALPYALRMISNLKPRLGAYACLGNHEYYRGVSDVIKAFSESPIPLLVGMGLTLKVGDSQLYIAGADDPRSLSRLSPEFFESTVKDSIRNAPEGAFRILMSHRPQGFEPAVRQGVELTLAGHTHGGQFGFGNVSAFEYFLPEKYLWGHYKKDNGSQLYTTCGMGHWFPFRLGCPKEAPIIVLERGNS